MFRTTWFGRWAVCLLFVLALVACGGGGGGGDDDSSSDNDNDNGGASHVSVKADAGSDRDVVTGTRVTLDGSDSDVDGDGDISYQWTLTSRPDDSKAKLADAATATPEFTADVDGRYVAKLTVKVGDASDTDNVTITATSKNTTPEADAGPDQQIGTGAKVTLDGSDSRDADGDSLTYRWQFDSRPDGSDASLKNAKSASPSFTADVAGRYIVTLEIDDGHGGKASDRVEIVAAVGNNAPVAEAGDDISVAAGDTADLDGIDSRDADDDKLSYSWRIVSQPDGSAASLANANSAKPSLTTDLAGDYVVELKVSDGQASDTDRVVVSAGADLRFEVEEGDGQSSNPTYKDQPNVVVIRYGITEAGNEVDDFVLKRFRLTAIGRSYSVADTSVKLVDSSNNASPQLRFEGFGAGTALPRGKTVTFDTELNDAPPGQYQFRATFTIAETGEQYRITYLVNVEE